MFKKIDSKPDFNKLELALLKFWKEKNVLGRSIEQRPDNKTKTFYDGPITANGDPHYGHMLTFAMKDIMPRFWTMKGFRVSRSLGWDCQGLPVEWEVEKNLGFKEKSDIENFGIANFNAECRKLVLKFRQAIVDLEERMGRLTNEEEEFATMDANYIESVWWSLKELYDKGLLYEGYKVVPYSTRAGTSLSNAEVALGGYEKFVDPAVTVMFELLEDPGTYVLAWTTTPWTLPTNFSLAVGEKIKYAKVDYQGKKYILAADLVQDNFPESVKPQPVKAADLIGKKYKPLFNYFPDKENAYSIVAGFHVTTDSGTGVVHLAPYGAEDNEIFKEIGIEPVDVLDDQGDFTKLIPELAGMNYRDANPKIIKMLEQSDLLFKHEDYEHDMPMCWRTSTPLIYKPITSWYIAMSTLRDELVANNKSVKWEPDYFKDGRFGNWLAEIKDWGISRLRYWGTPLPIWKSPSGKLKLVGSFAELKELSGKELSDPHRPFVDDIKFELDGEEYTRVPDVIDVWYDSGSMPFARFHYPFENKARFEAKFPAQYIAEGIDQTRGWFYSLMAISTALFNKTPYENVVVNGTAVAEGGAKLSKSKKNYEPPHKLLEDFGADAVRMNFFSSPISAGEDTTISGDTVRVQIQEFMLPVWNTLSYLVTYANIHGWQPRAELLTDMPAGLDNELDLWMVTTLQAKVAEINDYLDNYKFPKVGRALKDLITEVSRWYIRRSRDRFVAGDDAAISTLYYVLVTLSKLAAPVIPFLSEYIYQTLAADLLKAVPESVHLCDYPEANGSFLKNHQKILVQMQSVRAVAELGQMIRAENALKVRQPLAELQVQNIDLEEWMSALLMDELNIKAIKSTAKISSSKGYIQASSPDGQLNVAMRTELTPELEAEGLLRELIRTIQSLRKQAGLDMGDKVSITYSTTNKQIVEVIENNMAELKSAVFANAISEGDAKEKVVVNGNEVNITLHQ